MLRKRLYLYVLLSWVLTGAFGLSMAEGGAGTAGGVSVALLGPFSTQGQSPQEQGMGAAFVATLETQLAGQPDLVLVDRSHRDQVLKELELAQAGWADAQKRLQAGKLLRAELTVWVQWVSGPDATPWLAVRAMDSLTGTVRGLTVVPLQADALESCAAETAGYLHQVAVAPAAATLTVAVGVFENASRFQRLGALEFGLQELVSRQLQRRTTFRVMQRADMRPLLNELDLIRAGLADERTVPQSLPTRQASYLLTGTFKEVVESNPLRVAVHGELRSMLSKEAVWTKDLEMPVTQLDELAAAMSTGAIEYLNKGRPAPPVAGDAGSEAELLFQQVCRDVGPLRLSFAQLPFPVAKPSREQWFDSDSAPCYVALLRRVICRLQCVLFIRPDDRRAKLLLALCLNGHNRDLRDFEESERLMLELATAGLDDPYGLFALDWLPHAYWSESRATHDRRYLQLGAEGYVRLAALPDNRVLPGGGNWAGASAMAASCYKELGDQDAAWRVLEQAIGRASTCDPAWLGQSSSTMSDLARSLISFATADSAQYRAVVELLARWRRNRSDCLHYWSVMTLGELCEQHGNHAGAADLYWEATHVCDAQADEWSREQQPPALVHAIAATMRAQGPEQALELAGPYLSRYTQYPEFPQVPAGGAELCLALGKLYEATGQPAQAARLYADFQQRYGAWNRQITARLNAIRATLPASRPVCRLDCRRVAFTGFNECMCRADNVIWCGGNKGLRGLDLVSQATTVIDRPCTCAMTTLVSDGRWLWVGTLREGVWRLDLSSLGTSPKAWSHWTVREGLPSDRVSTLGIGDDGLYIGVGGGDTGGLIRLDDRGIFHAFEQEQAPKTTPNSIVITADAIWTGSSVGMYCFDRKRSIWLRMAEGKWTRVRAGLNRIFADIDVAWVYAVRLDGASGKLGCDLVAAPKSYRGLGNQVVAETPERIWFCAEHFDTEETAHLYAREKDAPGDFIIYGAEDGFRCRYVCDGLLVDQSLWLLTEQGLLQVRVAGPTTGPAGR